MNKLVIWALGALVVMACETDRTQEMAVTGSVKGLKKGVLYLQRLQDSSLVTIDSLVVRGDGGFDFKLPLESPEVFYLYLKKADHNIYNDRITFFGEPGTIRINTEWNAFDTKAKIEGSESHKKLEEYDQVMSRINTRNLDILRASQDPAIQRDSLALDSIRKLSDKNIVRGYLYALNFALNNADSYVAPYIALTEVSDANPKYLDSIYNALSPEVASSKYGSELATFLEKKKEEKP